MNYNEKENNRRWFVIGLLFNLLMIGVYVGTVSTISNYYNNTTGVTNHSNLTNLQGGLSPDEYYHLNSSFYTTLTGMKECGSSPLYYYALKYIGGSITCISIPVDDDSWQSTKVNKSGDTMTGTLNMNNKSMTYLSNVQNVDTFKHYYNNSSWYFPYDIVSHSIIGIPRFISYATGNPKTYFIGYGSNGNESSPSGILENEYFFRLAGAAMQNNSVFSGSLGIIDMMATQNITTAGKGAEIGFWTTPNNSGVPAKRMIIKNTGALQLNNLSGAGNAYVCVDANGMLYRGSPTC